MCLHIHSVNVRISGQDRNSDTQLSTAISAPALLKNLTIVFEPFTGTVNGLMLIAYLGVLWVESEQILQLKVGCPNFGPVRGLAIYPTYLR